jgi:phosphoglucomutase
MGKYRIDGSFLVTIITPSHNVPHGIIPRYESPNCGWMDSPATSGVQNKSHQDQDSSRSRKLFNYAVVDSNCIRVELQPELEMN